MSESLSQTPETEFIGALALEGEPVAKARPRLGKGGRVYTPDKTRVAEEEIGWRWRAQRPGQPDPDSRFGVMMTFYLKDGRGRRDVDNLTKTVLDALNGVVWKDDSQVASISAVVHRGCEKPGTTIGVVRYLDG